MSCRVLHLKPIAVANNILTIGWNIQSFSHKNILLSGIEMGPTRQFLAEHI